MISFLQAVFDFLARMISCVIWIDSIYEIISYNIYSYVWDLFTPEQRITIFGHLITVFVGIGGWLMAYRFLQNQYKTDFN